MPKRRQAPRARTKTILDRLAPTEAQTVLSELLRRRPEIVAEAEAIARALLTGISCEEVADDVEAELQCLDLDDVDSGPSRFGYIEPGEAVWNALHERLEPFIEDLTRHVELGLESEALEMCKGILLGLYRLRDSKGHEALEWVPDFPAEAAGDVIAAWRRAPPKLGGRKSRRDLPSAFVKRIPGWRDLIMRRG